MDPREQLNTILPALNDLVPRIQPWQLTDATPCANFDVRDVLNHMITLGGVFAYRFRGEEPPATTAPDVPGWVPVEPFQTAMRDLLDAVHTPGAMDRTLPTPLGQLPGSTFARLVAFDGLVHGWDLATATGLDWDISAEVVAAIDAFASDTLTDDLRDGDTFKAATTPPADATAIERVAAFSGRTVPQPAVLSVAG